MNPTLIRLGNAAYKMAQAVPLVAIFLGLSLHDLKLLLAVDFVLGVGLASVLDLPAPQPPTPPAAVE